MKKKLHVKQFSFWTKGHIEKNFLTSLSLPPPWSKNYSVLCMRRTDFQSRHLAYIPQTLKQWDLCPRGLPAPVDLLFTCQSYIDIYFTLFTFKMFSLCKIYLKFCCYLKFQGAYKYSWKKVIHFYEIHSLFGDIFGGFQSNI